MAEVGLNIKGDASGLQKAAKEAIKATQSIGTAAEKVQRNLNKIATAQERAANIVRNVTGRSAAEARADVDRLLASMNESSRAAAEASREFSSAAEGIDQVQVTAKRGSTAIKALRGVLIGGLGTVALSLIEVGLDSLGNKLVETFTKGKRAAEEAAEAMRAAAASVISLDFGQGQVSVSSRSELVELIENARANIARFESELKAAESGRQFAVPVAQPGSRVLAQSASAARSQEEIRIKKENLAVEEQILKNLQDQIIALDARNETINRLGGATVRLDPKNIFGSLKIEGDEIVPFDLSRNDEQDAIFQERKLENLQREIALYQETSKALSALNQDELDSISNAETKALSDEIKINNQTIFNGKVVESTQSLGAAEVAIAQFGAAGARALADVILGFEKLRDIGDVVGSIVRNLVGDLAAAAAKAALLSAITGGAGGLGFGGLFKRFLGLTPFASGGIVTGPTPALIGEAGPEAVIPLNKLSSIAGTQKMEVIGFRVGPGELLFTIQEAQQVRGVGGLNV